MGPGERSYVLDHLTPAEKAALLAELPEEVAMELFEATGGEPLGGEDLALNAEELATGVLHQVLAAAPSPGPPSGGDSREHRACPWLARNYT